MKSCKLLFCFAFFSDFVDSSLAFDDLSRTSSACVLDSSDVNIRQDSVHTYYDILPGEIGR